jgi:TRAP-type C4-dicarboxylate transport system permease small subunit
MKRILEHFLALILFVMFVITFFQVFARTVLQISSVWSEELARFTYVWMVFLGAALLIKDDGLIRVTVLMDRLGKRAAALLRLITHLATIPFIGVLTWGAWTNTRLNWNTFAPTIDWLRIGYVYLMIFLSGLLMLWYLLVNLVRQARCSFAKATRGPEGWQ